MFSAFDLCREVAFREFLAAVFLRAAEEAASGPLTLAHILLDPLSFISNSHLGGEGLL